jgi:hypothetical protein
MEANYVNLAGLIYDIVGAVLLGRAVIFNSKEKIAQQVGTAWGYNKHLIPVVVEGRIDAAVGLVVLTTGFVLQAISLFCPGNAAVTLVLVVVLAIVMVLYILGLSHMVQRQSKAVIEFIEERRQRN